MFFRFFDKVSLGWGVPPQQYNFPPKFVPLKSSQNLERYAGEASGGRGSPHRVGVPPQRGVCPPQKKIRKKSNFFPKISLEKVDHWKSAVGGVGRRGAPPKNLFPKNLPTKNLKHVLQLCNPAIWSPRNIHFITLLSYLLQLLIPLLMQLPKLLIPYLYSYLLHFITLLSYLLQLPVIPAFAITINKSQGQTYDHVGILLNEPVFSHGQLYVALSRSKHRKNIKIFMQNSSTQGQLLTNDDWYTKNVVFKEIFNM